MVWEKGVFKANRGNQFAPGERLPALPRSLSRWKLDQGRSKEEGSYGRSAGKVYQTFFTW